jgi:hypothetical protein
VVAESYDCILIWWGVGGDEEVKVGCSMSCCDVFFQCGGGGC